MKPISKRAILSFSVVALIAGCGGAGTSIETSTQRATREPGSTALSFDTDLRYACGTAIRSEEGRVLVAFGVVAQPGNAFNCQSNPPTPIVIDLGQVLGDRALVDAASLPYVDVRTIDPLGY